MVHENNEDTDIEVETTNEETGFEETELAEEEEQGKDKIKKLKTKIAQLEDDKKQLQDDLQRAKAEFLNVRKRLEEERTRDRVRARMQHVEEMLPLCDSFQMAMNDKAAWEKADEAWRKGVEGIHMQLMGILSAYGVKAVDPTGEHFDPNRHEAIGTEKVDDTKLQDTVVSVVQRGYEMTQDGKTELIRPARVTTGTLDD
ncbi:MAG: nucleotide exchange factor GrpE [Candidatus Kaiserbacteria bacterium]|nr:nucleotide exchange factor GrpE [Candidatus Kaiserbacteria bacterium]MCB9816034.1 nucleotide exchange factor GrpE [Candidatus Nomurabacteria bacterium]